MVGRPRLGIAVSTPAISSVEVANGLREFFADHPALADLRASLDAPDAPAWDTAVWDLLAGQLGVAGLVVPRDYGGIGLGAIAATGACYEAGIGLYPGPLRSTLIAALVLNHATPSTDTAGWMTGFADGELTATVALDESCVDASVANQMLSGTVRRICDAGGTDLLVVPYADNRVAVVRTDAPGVVVTPLRSTDPSHRYADILFSRVSAVDVIFEAQRLADVLDMAQLLIAAEAAGGTAGCLLMAADYARTRTQFDAPIATFQAISHRCAELAVDLEGLRSLVSSGARAADEGARARLRALAPLARAQASDVFCAAASTLIQVHGGIGFTWEHDAHLYFRRAHTLRHWFGSPEELREHALQRRAIDLIRP
ncbi:MAG: acyl-CoA/acyl-ACP dehydrogenase [Actinomycetota bacterium]|nr:acyl-CoA/acyl-ACP dehydrogenase [Actinomycetota bacterium]